MKINKTISSFLENLGLINTSAQNQIARNAYNEAITKSWNDTFKHYAREIHENNQSIAYSLSRQASAERNEIKYKIREEYNTLIERLFLNARDCLKGSSIKKTSEQEFYDAFKTGGGDLGLENNGFRYSIKACEILKQFGITDIYPEDITAQLEVVERFVNESKDTALTHESIELLGVNTESFLPLL